MTVFEKVKLLVLVFIALIFSIIFYCNGLNGRYVIHPNKAVIIDTRTGDVYNAMDKTKIN